MTSLTPSSLIVVLPRPATSLPVFPGQNRAGTLAVIDRRRLLAVRCWLGCCWARVRRSGARPVLLLSLFAWSGRSDERATALASDRAQTRISAEFRQL